MLEKGQFDNSVDDYLNSYSKTFDLWDEENPFLQRRGVNGKKKDNNVSVIKMFAAIPSGTNVAHWHHFGESEAVLSEDLAAQMLTTVSPFNFKVKPGEARTLAGDPPLYALVLGNNLFETIVMNLPKPNGRTTAKQELENGPAWRTMLELTNLPKLPTVTQGFTWPVRVVELKNDKDKSNQVIVKNAVYKAAYDKPTDKMKRKGGNLYDAKYGWRDPNAGTETTHDKVIHIKARPGIPVWRDAVPLFLIASEGEALRGDRRRSRPEVVSNALRIMDTPQFRVAVYGMRKKSGGRGDVKVEEWFRSILSLPAEVARDSRLTARAGESFKTTQKIADALRTALCMLRPPSEAKKTHLEEINTLNVFWQNLELVLTSAYLNELGGVDAQAEANLGKHLRQEARAAFVRSAGSQRHTAYGLFRIANASNWLERRLAMLLNESLKKSEMEI